MMGLGKTTQAIVGATALFEAGVMRRGLLVVPASLKPQWEREWQAVSDAPLRIVEGGADDRRSLYESTRRDFLVTNYEQVVRDLDAITAWAPDLVVLDEAQRIKNWATKTALTIKRLKPDFRLVLSGTPMENRLEELASVVEWVDDRALEPKWRLVPWHSTYADGNREVIGARNVDLLRKRLAPVLLRRVRSEVLAQLPPRQDTVIPVELTTEQREAHDDLNQPIAKLASVARRRPLTQGGDSLPHRRGRRGPQSPEGGERLHQPRAPVESRRARATDRANPPPGPEATDRRVQPGQPRLHRRTDRRARRRQTRALQGAVRGDLRPAPVRSLGRPRGRPRAARGGARAPASDGALPHRSRGRG
jgi:hypothetical protein